MSNPSDPQNASPQVSEEAYAKLSPEDRRRVSTAMRFLRDIGRIYLDGKQIAADMLDRQAPAADVAMRLMDFERDLRIAANGITKRPLEMLHADAFAKGQTRLDDSAWLMRCRIRASEARKVREEQARRDEFKVLAKPVLQEPAADEPDVPVEAGPRP